MSGPIRPEQIEQLKAKQIPEFVFEAFNFLIAREWNGQRASVSQSDVLAQIQANQLAAGSKFQGLDPLREKWLDVEGTYRAVGWKVFYDKPGYDECYSPFFVFTKA